MRGWPNCAGRQAETKQRNQKRRRRRRRMRTTMCVCATMRLPRSLGHFLSRRSVKRQRINKRPNGPKILIYLNSPHLSVCLSLSLLHQLTSVAAAEFLLKTKYNICLVSFPKGIGVRKDSGLRHDRTGDWREMRFKLPPTATTTTTACINLKIQQANREEKKN